MNEEQKQNQILHNEKEISPKPTAGQPGDSRGGNTDGTDQPRQGGNAGTTPVPAEDGASGVSRNGGKKRAVILGAAACVALLLLGVAAFTGGEGRTPGISDDTSRLEQEATAATLPEAENGTEAATVPVATISEEEQRYLQMQAYCEELAAAGRLEEALSYLLGCVPPDSGDPRLEELKAQYENLFVEDTLSRTESLCGQGQYLTAMRLLGDARRICDSQALIQAGGNCRQAFGVYNNARLAAGKYNTVLILDGYVNVCGESTYGEQAANNWQDIVAVSAGDRHILGLRSDGTVVAAGANDERQMDVANWWNVIAVSAGDTHSVGLCADGTVLATGYNHMGQCDVVNLMRAAGDLRIVSVAAGYGHTLALLEDGTVVATGVNEFGECSVYNWKDIAAIYAGTEFSAGLKVDGTVVVTGKGTENWDLSGWTDMTNLTAGDFYLVGVKADGTVVAEKDIDRDYEERGQANVHTWHDVVMIAAGNDHTVAIRADGTILCVGGDMYGQCDWNGMNIN